LALRQLDCLLPEPASVVGLAAAVVSGLTLEASLDAGEDALALGGPKVLR
jgi:hypothetical protein